MRITIKSPIEIEITETKAGVFDLLAPQVIAAVLPSLLKLFVRSPDEQSDDADPTAGTSALTRCPADHGDGKQCVRNAGHEGLHVDTMSGTWATPA